MDILSSSRQRDIREFSLSYDELDHDPKDIIAVLGYADGEAPEHLYAIFDEVIAEGDSLCRIRSGYRHFSDVLCYDDKKHYRIHDVVFDIGETISYQLRKAQSVLLFVCTIGAGLENWCKQLMNEGDFLKGYMVDAVASQTIELALDKIQNYLEQEQGMKGIRTTNRYSPGYCGWHVSEQQKLFSLLPKNFCDIRLTESCLMLPIKSVSGIIGLGPAVRKMDYICRLCDMKDCNYRRRFEKSQQDV